MTKQFKSKAAHVFQQLKEACVALSRDEFTVGKLLSDIDEQGYFRVSGFNSFHAWALGDGTKIFRLKISALHYYRKAYQVLSEAGVSSEVASVLGMASKRAISVLNATTDAPAIRKLAQQAASGASISQIKIGVNRLKKCSTRIQKTLQLTSEQTAIWDATIDNGNARGLSHAEAIIEALTGYNQSARTRSKRHTSLAKTGKLQGLLNQLNKNKQVKKPKAFAAAAGV